MTVPGTGGADGVEHGGGTGEATVTDLLGDDDERFEAALADPTVGPVAVLGDPFAGREAVLDRAADRLDAERVRLGPRGDAATVEAALDGGPLVVEGCHQLYARTIGGFDELEAFLAAVAGVDAPVVTGWNRYAWAYLKAVRGVDRTFPVTVEVGPVEPGRLAELVLARYETVPAFVADDPDRGGLVAVRRYSLGVGDRTVSVPVPVPGPAARTAVRTGSEPGPEAVVFERLAAVSRGNVGVAAALLEARTGTGAVRPSEVVAPGTDLALDREEAFCLRVVLATERIERTELADVVGDGLDRILGRLTREGLVTVADGVVSLDPTAVPSAVRETERSRIA